MFLIGKNQLPIQCGSFYSSLLQFNSHVLFCDVKNPDFDLSYVKVPVCKNLTTFSQCLHWLFIDQFWYRLLCSFLHKLMLILHAQSFLGTPDLLLICLELEKLQTKVYVVSVQLCTVKNFVNVCDAENKPQTTSVALLPIMDSVLFISTLTRGLLQFPLATTCSSLSLSVRFKHSHFKLQLCPPGHVHFPA